MANTTKLTLTIVTEKDLLSGDAVKLVKNIRKFLPLIELTGFGEKIGIESIDVRLTEKPLP